MVSRSPLKRLHTLPDAEQPPVRDGRGRARTLGKETALGRSCYVKIKKKTWGGEAEGAGAWKAKKQTKKRTEGRDILLRRPAAGPPRSPRAQRRLRPVPAVCSPCAQGSGPRPSSALCPAAPGAPDAGPG